MKLNRRPTINIQRAGKTWPDFHCELLAGAQLNVGDCFAAALTEREQLPLAYACEDFAAAGF